MSDKLHPSHETRISDASSFDEICIHCGATDRLGSWGALAKPCSARPDWKPAPAAMSEPGEWAVQKARRIVLSLWPDMSAESQKKIDQTPLGKAIAHAIEAADKAATERAAVWHETEAANIEMQSQRTRGKIETRQPLWHRRAAAAIRKGEPQ